MKFSSEKPKIIVVGSSSVDIILRTNDIPCGDQTVMATDSESFFGGKGANQAVASARLGSSVFFVGCVGMDPFGQQIMRNLVDEGINVGFLKESEDAETGTAYVTSANGKNAIVVSPSANFDLKPADIREAEKFFSTADLVLVQLEIPMSVVQETFVLAKKYGRKIGIYASPGSALPQDLVDYATFIVVKEGELSKVFGTENQEEILQKLPNKLFIRNSKNETHYFDGNTIQKTVSAEIGARTMGMGDAFTAGFGVALCHGNSVKDCVDFGTEISRRVSMEIGSQKGLPFAKELF